MMLAALALAAALASQPQAAKPAPQQPSYVPDRVRAGCGYTPGSTALVPIEVGVFFDGDPPFVNANGHAIRINGQWTHPDRTPYRGGESRSWYRNQEPITVRGRNYVKYGLPRVLGIDEVSWFAELDGLAVAAEPGATRPEVVYVLVDPAGCGFQPYQREV